MGRLAQAELFQKREAPPKGRLNWLVLIGLILINVLIGALGSVFVSSSVNTWYADLIKLPIAPPAWLFAPVWSALYLMMAIAAWLTWRRASFKDARFAYMAYGLQLILNLLWTALFFGLRNPLLAFVDILVLTVTVRVTQLAFSSISPLAGHLMLPYVIWLVFASILNAGILVLNG